MLTSTVVKLHTLAPGTLPNTTGSFGRAVFLNLIETVAPDISSALHDRQGRKPFTVSPLNVGKGAQVDGHIQLRGGDGCSIRFTILDPALFTAFQSAFLVSALTAKVYLQHVPFVVEDVITTPGNHNWAGYTTFSELRERARTDRLIKLRFYSPTAFSLEGNGQRQFALLPEPWRVFDSLCRQWNEFADIPFDAKQLRTWAGTNLLVSEIRDLKTELLRFDRFVQKGFTGSVVYEIKDDDADMARVINTLADLALYAGVGSRTTMGMGQTRRV